MVSKFNSSSSDLSRQISNSLSTDLKPTPDSSLNIYTDSLNSFNTNKYFQGSSSLPVATDVSNSAKTNTPFSSGYYTVGETGKVSFDYVFDGSKHQGELAIFSLEGMGKYNFDSKDFIREAARRALSNSKLGHVVISDRTEGARFNGSFAWEKSHNTEKHQGIKDFEMERGNQFGVMFAPNRLISDVLKKPNAGRKSSPLFSLASSQSTSPFAQFAERKTDARIFAIEDGWNGRKNNRDFNDFVFYMEGATGNAPPIDSVINPARNWRNSDVAKQISEWIPAPEILPKNGDLVKGSDGKVYQIEAGQKRWIPNPGIFRQMGFKDENVKTFADEKISNIPLGEKFPIPKEYQESPQAGSWNSEFYSWDGKDLPSLNFSDNKDNQFATLNLDSDLVFPAVVGAPTDGIAFNWGSASPKNDSKLLDDNFVIRSYTQTDFIGGIKYKATVRADDGYQLFARNQNTGNVYNFTDRDKWSQDAYGQTKEIEFAVPESGKYDLYFQYFERTGDAYFSFVWGKQVEPPQPVYKLVKGSEDKVFSVEDGKKRLIPNPGIFQAMEFKNEDVKTLSDEELNKIPSGEKLPIPQEYVTSQKPNEWYGKFYSWDGKDKPSLKFSENQENQFAALNLGSNANGIKFDWGNGSPNKDTKLLSDNFAIAASKEVTFEDGTYTFSASGDDGFQIFAKKVGTNDPVINITPQDKWTQAYRRPFQTEVNLNGKYELYFNFYEQGENAKFDLSWNKNNSSEETRKARKYEFTYFFNGENKEGSDYYTGWVIAEPGKYKIGEYVDPNLGDNEVGKNGRYKINSDVEVDEGKAGEVFVNRYYDSEYDSNYDKVHFKNKELSGTNGLGSEINFIGSAGSDDIKFGQDNYEFDLPDPMSFSISSIGNNLGIVQYSIGTPKPYAYQWGKGYGDITDDPDKDKPNEFDKIAENVYRTIVSGLSLVLPNGASAYFHYLDGTGSDRTFSYEDYINNDESGYTGFRNILTDAKLAVEEIYRKLLAEYPELVKKKVVFKVTSDANPDSIDVNGLPVASGVVTEKLPYSKSADWKAALGSHAVWINADIIVSPGGKRFNMDVKLHAEDKYDFNPEARADARLGGIDDSLSGRLEVVGLAKSYINKADLNKSYSWYEGQDFDKLPR